VKAVKKGVKTGEGVEAKEATEIKEV